MKTKFDIPAAPARILAILEKAGHEAYLVGGCVRDALLGLAPADWDICTSARPKEVKACMARAKIKCVDTGIKHGTVSVIIDGAPFEVTTYRAEGPYTDGRRPDTVTFLSEVKGDLYRRDFTINAMAYHPERGLLDPCGGACDLQAGVLRCVGVAHERFEEDALRILRGLRFASTYALTIEPSTAAAIHADCELLAHNVAAERIWAEFSRLLCGRKAVEILRAYSDVVAVIIPEIKAEFGFEQHNPYHKYDVWEHTLHALAAAPPSMDATVRFALLLHDIGKPESFTMEPNGRGHCYGHDKIGARIAQGVCERFHMSRAARETVVHLVRWHMFSIPDTPKKMRRFLLKHGEKQARTLLILRRCDKIGLGRKMGPDNPLSIAFARALKLIDEVIAEQAVFGLKDLAINGHDLMNAGFDEGPLIGQTLNKLLEAVVDGELPNERDALLRAARKARATQA